MRHTRQLPSALAEHAFVPSVERATAVTSCRCPSRGQHLNFIPFLHATSVHARRHLLPSLQMTSRVLVAVCLRRVGPVAACRGKLESY